MPSLLFVAVSVLSVRPLDCVVIVLIWNSFQHSQEIFPQSGHSFPSFHSRADWYDLPLLTVGNNPLEPIKYKTQDEAIRNALAHAKVKSTQSTHFGRKTGARLAEAGGAAEGDIARAGNWAQGVMENVYLAHIPRQTIRAVAGFKAEGGNFYLPRGVEVPQRLQTKIFPRLEEW